jgi:hypothetical protein
VRSRSLSGVHCPVSIADPLYSQSQCVLRSAPIFLTFGWRLGQGCKLETAERMAVDLTQSRHASKWLWDLASLQRKTKVVESFTEDRRTSLALSLAKVGHSRLSRAELVESEALQQVLTTCSSHLPPLDATNKVLISAPRAS